VWSKTTRHLEVFVGAWPQLVKADSPGDKQRLTAGLRLEAHQVPGHGSWAPCPHQRILPTVLMGRTYHSEQSARHGRRETQSLKNETKVSWTVFKV
jgi:hypothetical protein